MASKPAIIRSILASYPGRQEARAAEADFHQDVQISTTDRTKNMFHENIA